MATLSREDGAKACLDSLDREEKKVPPVDFSSVTTLHGSSVEDVRKQQAEIPTGQFTDYIVLSDEERAKGFVRPVRKSYTHVGKPAPKYPLRDLTPEEKDRYNTDLSEAYVKFEAYPSEMLPKTGRYWTQEEIDAVDHGCGTVTTMGTKLAETYARSPQFYGATFCCGCDRHLPVGPNGEFVWLGTDERVGT